MSQLSNENIQLYRSIFCGRDDVFAVYWEKKGKSGYVPAHTFDPYLFKRHLINGGTFKNFVHKEHKPLTDQEVLKHLNGEQLAGIYPLLKDNTSWFIAADFDEQNWKEECLTYIKLLYEKGIPAYLERSRSGNGGHIWIFFEKAYPAFKSRKILISLLEQASLFSIFDKQSSFDRLFPNQDYLSGKGLGNLIALPFHKPAMEQGNSCFVDPETFEPYKDQWLFLKNIQKISVEKLDALFGERNQSNSIETKTVFGKLNIRLRNAVYVNRSGLTTQLINFIKEELNFANTEFFVKKQTGRNTWGTQRHFKMIEETERDIILPRGFIGKLIRFCRDQEIEHEFNDERQKLPPVIYNPSIDLREYQKPAIDATDKKYFGVIVAPPGSGKTIIGLSIIAHKCQPALIVVHRKQLADQWTERIESFLGIPKREIGKIGTGKNTIGKQITIAMIQSLEKTVELNDTKKLLESFGTIIVDECHHVPAETFRNTISKFNSYYVYGFTATPFRKYNDGKLIFIHLGDIISEIKPQDISESPEAKIVVRNTDLFIPFNAKTDKYETISKVLVHDSSRNKLILDDVIAELEKGKKAVIVTERKEHIDTLFQYLKQKYEAITLSGDDSDSNKSIKWKILNEGNFQVLITTGQYFGEGSDLQKIEYLFLVYPFSFEGKLIQYIGRVQRSEVTPVIYDYRDHKIDYLEKLFQKRNAYYKKFYLRETLFDLQKNEAVQDSGSFIYQERLTIPFNLLEFKFGLITFKYHIPQYDLDFSFDIENYEMRPEFEVLKPYFEKILKLKKVKIDVLLKVHQGVILEQTASSTDMNKINREIIDSVKFRFIEKGIIGKSPLDKENLLDIADVQENKSEGKALYNSEQDLLGDILKNQNFKHHQQLIFLSQKHQNSVLKLRFVLSPFSFVFLLSGDSHYHIVWETLDTEEATYIWHVSKNTKALKTKLRQIDSDLGIIRSKGRQYFIETQPDNFNRIVHDYSDGRKGFVIWKGHLEEKLT